jgi:hypothetical protein
MPQSRNELVENRICTFPANLFYRCLDFADFDDALIDFVVCVGNELFAFTSSAIIQIVSRESMDSRN